MPSRRLVVGSLVLGLASVTGCGDSTSPQATTPITPGKSEVTAPVNTTTDKAAPSAPQADQETPRPVEPDPLEVQAGSLVEQLLLADEAGQASIAEQLRAIENYAVPALLAKLLDADEFRPVVLSVLHQITGFTAPCETTNFSIAVMPAEARANTDYQYYKVPAYRLDTILSAAVQTNPSVRRAALRYLRELGYVGEHRLAVADVAWDLALADPVSGVRAEAQALRTSQTDIAVSMTTDTLSPFLLPTLPMTAEWFAHLGSEAVRRGLQEPYGERRVANSLESTREYSMQSLKAARMDARRAYLDQVRADIIQNARDRQGYVSPQLRQAIPSGVHVAALDRYIHSLGEMEDPLTELRDQQQSEAKRLDYERTVQATTLAISILQTARDGRLVQAAAALTDVDLERLGELSLVDNGVHKLALSLANRFAEQGDPVRARFWADEAIACYRDWPLGLHPGCFQAVLASAAAARELGAMANALTTLELGTGLLVEHRDYVALQENRADARQLRASLHELKAQILDQLGRSDEAKFHRAEQARFLAPLPDDATFQNSVQLAKQGDEAYEQGDFATAAELMLQARNFLDPPGTNTLQLVTTLHLRLGDSLRELGRIPEARCIVQQGMVLATRRFGLNSHHTAPMVVLLGSVQRESGELEEAEHTLSQAGQLYRDRLEFTGEVDPLELANRDYHIGVLRSRQGRTEEARQLLQAALRIQQSNLGDQDHRTRQTQQALDELAKGQ